MSIAPPRLYRNARVLLPEPAAQGTDAVATVGDRIVAVGTVEACRAALPSGAEEVDLAGHALAPGFVDAHLHPLVMCVFEQQLVLDRCESVAEVLEAVADAARATEAGRTIVGFQLDDAVLAERRMPTSVELDRAGDRRHVVLVRRDGHHAVASNSALRAVGYDRVGSDPAGGRIDRHPDGTPTGLVREIAVAPLLGLMAEVTFDELEIGLASWSQRLVSQGITAISAICQTTAEGPAVEAGVLEAMGWSVLVDRVPFDVQTILIADGPGAVAEAQATALHRPEAGRRVDAVKLFLDGTLGGHTACMHAPFSDHPASSGIATMTNDHAYQRMEAAHLAGLQVCIHAIGDRANRDAAELYDRLLHQHPGSHRHRVEHASVLDERTVELFAEHQITAVVQPISLRSEHHWLNQRLGPDRIQRTYPYRTLLDAGIPVAGSSDAPIEATEVIAAMAAAVDRPDLAPAQALSGTAALKLFTSGASAAQRTEDRLGSIAVGLRADLVVLDGDPTSVAPERLGQIGVVATIIGGRHVHGQLQRSPHTEGRRNP